MMYSSNIQKKIMRHQRFYQPASKGLMCQIIPSFQKYEVPAEIGFNEIDWKNNVSVQKLMSRQISNLKLILQQRLPIDDDWIPSVQVLAGTGMAGAMFIKDAQVHHEADTNYLWALKLDLNDAGYARIGFDPENPWFIAHVQMLEQLLREFDGSYGICPISFFDPLDLANQIRGNETFCDFDCNPAELHRLLDICMHAILESGEYIRHNYLDKYGVKGSCIGGTWIENGGYLSCDIGDMISSDYLKDNGLEWTGKIIEVWGGGFLHHHELGIHQIPNWSTLEKLNIQFLNRDPNTRHLDTCIDDAIIKHSKSVPVSFVAEACEFLKSADYWATGKFFVNVLCRNEKELTEVINKYNKMRD